MKHLSKKILIISFTIAYIVVGNILIYFLYLFLGIQWWLLGMSNVRMEYGYLKMLSTITLLPILASLIWSFIYLVIIKLFLKVSGKKLFSKIIFVCFIVFILSLSVASIKYGPTLIQSFMDPQTYRK